LHEESLDFVSAVAQYEAALELFDAEPNLATSAERDRLTDLRSAAHKLQLEAEAKQAEDQRLAAVAAATAKAEKCLIKSKWTGEIAWSKALEAYDAAISLAKDDEVAPLKLAQGQAAKMCALRSRAAQEEVEANAADDDDANTASLD